MERNEVYNSRLSHQKKSEAKKKSRSLPSHNKAGGIKMDHAAIFAAYRREEQKVGESSLSSDTSCSSLEFLKPNEISDSKKFANDSSSSTEKRNHSLDSLTRKERMEALKARVEAERLKYGESSSDDEKDKIKRLSRYHSDEAIHRMSRDPSRSRSGRTERFLKRRSQDESSLRNFTKGKPPAGRAGKSGPESHSPVPIKAKTIPQEIIAPMASSAPVTTPLNVATFNTRNDSNPCQPSPNDSGVSTQSVASSPSIGRAPSPKRWQEPKAPIKIEPASKMRFRNFSCSDKSRSSTDIRTEKCAHSPVPTSPVPRIHPEYIHRCRRLSTGDAENCGNNGRAMAMLRPKFPDCCCHSERMCCSVPFRYVPHCGNPHINCNRKPVVYSYTDQAPKYSLNSSSHVKKMISKIQKSNEEKLNPNYTTEEWRSGDTNICQQPETKIPSCPIHYTKSRVPYTLPNKMSSVDYHSAIPRLCMSGHKPKSPPSPNCRPLSMVIDTLDYLTNPRNYADVSHGAQASVQNSHKPIPPVPPIRKYHWNSTMNLNASKSRLEDIMKKTRNSLTSPESDYKVGLSDSNESLSKSNISRPNNNKSTENLDQALKELEEIYKSLQLNDDDLADRAERRDLPTRYQEQYSSANSRNSVTPNLRGDSNDPRRFDDNLQKRPISRSYDCLLVCNRPVTMRAPPLRRAGISDKVTDDFAYRRFQRAVSQNKQPRPENAQSYLLCSSVFTPSLNVNEYFKDLTAKSQPDVEKDDLSYRNYTQSIGAKVPNVQPPFGIPLGPVVKSSSTSYLQASPKEDTRPIYRHQETPDVVRDDMAYRNLRKDITLMFTRQSKKHRAVRSLSANISHLVQQHKAEESEKEMGKAQSMNDIIAALEKQSSEWKNLSRLVSPEHIKSPESSSPDDSTPRFNGAVSGTSDGLTLSESSTECKSPKKEFREKRTQPEGSENIANVEDREQIPKNKSVLVDCCRLVSAARDARKHKSLSVYQPSVSSPPPLRYQDVWSDSDIKMKRRTIALDENQLDALLNSLSRDTKQSKAGEELPLTTKSSYVDLRVTA